MTLDMANYTDARAAALAYLDLGIYPVPIPKGEKGPRLQGWQNLRVSADKVASIFDPAANIGILTGAASNGLIDVDLDVPEAVTAARRWLPPTGWRHGRPGKRSSHYYYRGLGEEIRRETFEVPPGLLETKVTLIELRGTGCQTLTEPSTHPSGEPIEWEELGALADVAVPELRNVARRIAACALLARFWQDGQRHDASLALAGYLLRRAWPEERVAEFLDVMAEAVDADRRKVAADVRDTAERLRAGQPTTGGHRLHDYFPRPVLDTAFRWLDVPSDILPLAPPVSTSGLSSTSARPNWPDAIDPAAYHGIAGDLVRTVEPFTEADPVAVLIHFLVMTGNAIGRGPYFRVSATEHHANLFAILVGDTSRGRKGTSENDVRQVLRNADSEWTANRIQSGLSSGEGLIHAVRDPQTKEQPVREKGRVSGYEQVRVDEGVSDKRLMVIESEFASTLRVMTREGNILSAVVRQAWDSGDLRIMTRNSPEKATDAHIAVLGHITRQELLRNLGTTEAANGFGNRFLWMAVKRSKLLPDGGAVPATNVGRLGKAIEHAIVTARAIGEVRRDDRAAHVWRDGIYAHLSRDRAGMLGSLTSRAEAQVVRLSLLYALLDGSDLITEEHLLAALAVWTYAEDSARYIFGESVGDATADRILTSLRRSPDGLTRTQISDLFQRNVNAAEIERALELLRTAGLVDVIPALGSRGAERWVAP
jgi:hypothetical protein